jgi:lysozyme-like protein
MAGHLQPHYTAMQLQQLWLRAGGSVATAPMAAAIALAESGGDPNAINHNTNGSIDRGLWQINSVHGAQSTLDPAANAQAAVAISQGGKNWQPWTTYITGAYKKFLGEATSSASTATATEGDPITNALPNIPNPLSGLEAIGNFFNKLTDPQLWLRVLEVLAGVALLIMGLMSLSGRTTTPVTVARTAGRTARKGATAAAMA